MEKHGIYILDEGFNTQKQTRFDFSLPKDCIPARFYGLEANIKTEQAIRLTVWIGTSRLQVTLHGGGYHRVCLPVSLFQPAVMPEAMSSVCFECHEPFGLEEVHFKLGKSISVSQSGPMELTVINCEAYVQNIDFYGEDAPEAITLKPYESRVLRTAVGVRPWIAMPNGQGCHAELISVR